MCTYIVSLESIASRKYRYRSFVLLKPPTFEGWPPGPRIVSRFHRPTRRLTLKSQKLSNQGAMTIISRRDVFKRDYTYLIPILFEAILSFALMSEVVENTLRFWHILSYISSAYIVTISDPGHARSGHQVTPSDLI